MVNAQFVYLRYLELIAPIFFSISEILLLDVVNFKENIWKNSLIYVMFHQYQLYFVEHF